MNRLRAYKQIIVCLMLLGFVGEASAYEVETHAMITKEAFSQAQQTKDFLAAIGYTSDSILTMGTTTYKIIEWAMEGSKKEDETFALDNGGENFRYLHHFYDPVSDRGLDVWLALAGIPYWHVTGHKAPDWALEDNGTAYATQFYSYLDAKSYYYSGLTATTGAEREANLAKAFRSLGQVMHVLEDMAQPQHTRNDPHGGDILGTPLGPPLFGTKSQYELYVDANRNAFNYTASYPVSFDVARKFYVTDDGKGMANFSNRSFVTAGTNIDCTQANVLDCQGATGGGYPSPALDAGLRKDIPLNQLPGIISNSTDLVTFFGNDINDNYSGQIIHNDFMTTYSLFDRDLLNQGSQPVFTLNRFNYAAMAQILLPRSVGYSAGLLNYFFRGGLYLYPFIDGWMYPCPGCSGSYIIRNDIDEDMDGTFELYYDNKNDERVKIDLSISNFTIGKVSSGNNRSPVFFTPPIDAKEPNRYILVFRGKMGNEDDAVVARIIRTDYLLDTFNAPDGTLTYAWGYTADSGQGWSASLLSGGLAGFGVINDHAVQLLSNADYGYSCGVLVAPLVTTSTAGKYVRFTLKDDLPAVTMVNNSFDLAVLWGSLGVDAAVWSDGCHYGSNGVASDVKACPKAGDRLEFQLTKDGIVRVLINDLEVYRTFSSDNSANSSLIYIDTSYMSQAPYEDPPLFHSCRMSRIEAGSL